MFSCYVYALTTENKSYKQRYVDIKGDVTLNAWRKTEYGDVRLADEWDEIRPVLIEPHNALSDHRLPWRCQGDGNSVRNAMPFKQRLSQTPVSQSMQNKWRGECVHASLSEHWWTYCKNTVISVTLSLFCNVPPEDVHFLQPWRLTEPFEILNSTPNLNFLGTNKKRYCFLPGSWELHILEVQGSPPEGIDEITQISQYIQEQTHQSLIFLSPPDI